MHEDLNLFIAERFKNTELGFLRIKKNLGILNYSDEATERFLKEIILATPVEKIAKQGKNYYFTCVKFNALLTVNSHSFTVITAKKIVQRLASQ
ncbi:DUF3781 domain-containing protein [Pelobacter seleniigenes]|uniref:DUF3781 domain-containing protein n=1 Tax=Pelobacter seleniigenes TaxID=407188 RepID=UPI0004A75E45|nr:DUF3781 domain-containing protein [Pelobacter seleniigenes]